MPDSEEYHGGGNLWMNDEQSYESLASEVDYVVSSLEKGLDRLTIARVSAPISNLMLAVSIAGVGLAFVASNKLESGISSLFNPAVIIIYATIYIAFSFYLYDFLRARRESSRRLRVLYYQAELAEETLKNLKSWVDRSQMPHKVRVSLKLRSRYLNALILEVQSNLNRGLF